MKKTALIAGATGLVGRSLVDQLLVSGDYHQITVLSRRSIGITHNRLKEIIIADFEELEKYEAEFDCTHVFCCLGTTRKEAGSKENFIRIDKEYPLQMAKFAQKKPSFEGYYIVTALGSNAESALFYNQVKGEVENELKELYLKSLHIFRPSLLLGKRKKQRWVEEVAKGVSAFLSFFFIGSFRASLWSIDAHVVAKAMIEAARINESGVHYYSPSKIRELSKV